MPDVARKWDFYIVDMIRFASNVAKYTEVLERHALDQHGVIYDATLRNLELIGEAATHIPQMIRDAHPTIPWRKIIATRNRLIHGYLGIDDDTIWSIIRTDVPLLLDELANLKQREAEPSE
jgi:uncharacterized protein with HEPN domain